jgi:hypothetical protein
LPVEALDQGEEPEASGDGAGDGMTDEPDETADLATVRRLLSAGRGIVVERYSKAETRERRTPDLRSSWPNVW